MGNTYWALFDARGRVAKVLLDGIHVKTDEQRQMLMREGYKNIDDETYNVLMGNRGTGDNGTGYIRDPKTGKPVSAPPAPPVEVEPQEPPVDEERLAAFEAMAAQEARLVAHGERLAALEAALKAKGGEGK